jgi:hypothetical protein
MCTKFGGLRPDPAIFQLAETEKILEQLVKVSDGVFDTINMFIPFFLIFG